jgi:hypothetical protein
LPWAARLDHMIVQTETNLTPLMVDIELRGQAGLETARLRHLQTCLERHLSVLYRNRALLRASGSGADHRERPGIGVSI